MTKTFVSVARVEDALRKQLAKSGDKKLPTPAKSNWPSVEAQNQEDKSIFQLNDCAIELFHVDREIWKGITKADLITYYHHVHEYILQHLKDRPLSLHFKIDGPIAPEIYQVWKFGNRNARLYSRIKEGTRRQEKEIRLII